MRTCHPLWRIASPAMLLTLLSLLVVLSSPPVALASSAAPQRADASAPHATFPFYDGFESGTLGADWTVQTTNEGRVQVSADYAYSGTYSLLLDDYKTDPIYSTAAAILTIDLSGQSQVDLDFWCRDFLDEDHIDDGLFLSDDDGANWYKIFSFDTVPGFWRHYIIDLDEEAANHSLAFNDHFQIKFQSYDDDPIPTDGYGIDEVQLRLPPTPTPAAFPYFNGFESGALGDEWLVEFTNEGRVQVGDYDALDGTYSLLLDDYKTDPIYSTAAAILTVDLSSQSDVVLDFWWCEFLDEDHGEDGVFISDDDGANWHPLLSFNGGTSAWQREVIDLDAATTSLGLMLNDHFQVKFQFYDDDPIPSDGYAIDEIRVRPNIAPALAWPGDTDYEQDGLDPESGDVRDTYVYRIRYTDADGDPPATVQVHIEKGGTDIAGSPFTMNCASGDYAGGVICSHSQMGLDEGSDYVYYFAAQDDQGNAAESTPKLDAPDATIHYWVYLPAVLKNAGPPPGPPVLDPIDNPEGHFRYTVSWSLVEGANRYALEEDDNASFSSPETVYDGSNTSASVLAEAVGTYYYRVKASNEYGETGWSNIESTVVTVPLPPCPNSGYWAGLTDQGREINFDVEDSPDCEITRLSISARLRCIPGTYYVTYTRNFWSSEPIIAWEFQYLKSGTNLTERVGGTFSSGTAASGRWYFYVPDPALLGRFCVGTGTWTASH
jgi:hypothetical protein